MKKINFIRITAIFIIAILSTNFGYSQKDWETKLKEDLVKVVDNKYNINEFALITIEEQTFQIKMSAEAPLDVISRDNFISTYSSLGTMMMLSMFAEAGYSINEIEIKELDELIGQPDITFNFIMAKNGMQIQIITDEGSKRLTMSWDEFFGS
jgi:hypothetical protein